MFDEDFKVVRVEPQHCFNEEDPLSIQYRMAECQFLRMQHMNNHKISSIDVVHNAALKTKFEVRKKELESKGCGDSLLLFHGTPQSDIDSILRCDGVLLHKSILT